MPACAVNSDEELRVRIFQNVGAVGRRVDDMQWDRNKADDQCALVKTNGINAVWQKHGDSIAFL